VSMIDRQLLEGAAALGYPALHDKLAAFGALLSEILRQHDGAWRVATYADPAVVSADAKARARQMGRPVRYAECLYAGDAGATESPFDAAHRVNVFLYRGNGPSEPAADELAFRHLLEAADPARPGVLWALRALGEAVIPEGRARGHALAFEVEAGAEAALVTSPTGHAPEHQARFSVLLR
jgi:hypothetical protein